MESANKVHMVNTMFSSNGQSCFLSFFLAFVKSIVLKIGLVLDRIGYGSFRSCPRGVAILSPRWAPSGETSEILDDFAVISHARATASSPEKDLVYAGKDGGKQLGHIIHSAARDPHPVSRSAGAGHAFGGRL